MEDLMKCGSAMYQSDDDGTIFMCDIKTFRMERVIIRSLLTPLGYKIISEDEYFWDEDDAPDWEIKTNMPWEKYKALSKDVNESKKVRVQ